MTLSWADKLKRFKNRCAYCGKRSPECGPLTRDHVKPKSKGGTEIVPACKACNNEKRDMSLAQYRDWLVLQGRDVRFHASLRLRAEREPR